MQKTDVGTGIGLLAFSTWVFLFSSQYSKKAVFFYGPNFFPQLLAVAMAICACVLIYKGLKGLNDVPLDKIHFKGFLRMLIAIGMCIAYLYLMQFIGFALSTIVFLFSLMTFLEHKGILVRAASSICVAMIVWSIFEYFLIIPVPTGIFKYTF
jgi:putative tricarboxylic transport membrane protein